MTTKLISDHSAITISYTWLTMIYTVLQQPMREDSSFSNNYALTGKLRIMKAQIAGVHEPVKLISAPLKTMCISLS